MNETAQIRWVFCSVDHITNGMCDKQILLFNFYGIQRMIARIEDKEGERESERAKKMNKSRRILLAILIKIKDNTHFVWEMAIQLAWNKVKKLVFLELCFLFDYSAVCSTRFCKDEIPYYLNRRANWPSGRGWFCFCPTSKMVNGPRAKLGFSREWRGTLTLMWLHLRKIGYFF